MGNSNKENLFAGFSREEYIRFRKLVIKMILNTDMKFHFEIMNKFKLELEKDSSRRESILNNQLSDSSENQNLSSNVLVGSSVRTLSEKKSHLSSLNSQKPKLCARFKFDTLKKFSTIPMKEEFEDETLSFFMHTADLSGAAKNFELSKVWAQKINQEFSSQFREETELGLPQTPHFKDLELEDVFHKNEADFRKFIILPLYQTVIKLNSCFFDCNKGLKVAQKQENKKSTVKPKSKFGNSQKISVIKQRQL
jgi:hypothetical protein